MQPSTDSGSGNGRLEAVMEMADPVKQRRKVAKAPSSLSLNGSWSVLVAKADAF